MKSIEIGYAERRRRILQLVLPAPIARNDNGDVVVSRHLTWLERLRVLAGAPVTFRPKHNTVGESDGG